MEPLRYRQVHLDFHTSEEIPGIGAEWNARHFQEMLRLGRVNSVTVFAKCHHGWSYHPTKVPLSRMHPHLSFDLLGAQIEAAHAIGVNTPVYLSVGLDEKLVRTHSHWLRRLPDATTTWAPWLQAGYHEFCLRSGYLDYVVAQAEEVVARYDADGLFLDIVGPRDCACQACAAELIRRGKDPRDAAARRALGRETYLAYARRINAAIRRKGGKRFRTFHNGGHIARGDRALARVNTHLELESLPTGGWGYDHFPLSAAYVRGLGMEYLGMTGKFHTSWGEFGGFKHPSALRYEAGLSLAYGARLSIGDQMHPRGRLDRATYALIGRAYAEVERKEPWCRGAVNVAEVGLLSLESLLGEDGHHHPGNAATLTDAGALRVLQEGKLLFDVLDLGSPFERYRVIILPDGVPASAALDRKLRAYLRAGGRVLATGTSPLPGIRDRGETPYSPSFIAPRFRLPHWEPAVFVTYGAMRSFAGKGFETIADRQDPYFNRDLLHFSSHQHTPNRPAVSGPAMVASQNAVYMAFPAFRQYAEMGQAYLREIVLHGLRLLLPDPVLETGLPVQGIQALAVQGRRHIVHLLYASPVKRGAREVIEDLVPLHDVEVSLRLDRRPGRVFLAPEARALDFRYQDGRLGFRVPRVTGHQMVVAE